MAATDRAPIARIDGIVIANFSTIPMSTDRTNYLNLALMMLSALAAFILPFHVFLFAYVVLGPLHYLTEISWLHDRGYFLKGKRDHFPLVLLCVVLLALSFSHYPLERKNQITTLVNYTAFGGAAVLLMTLTNARRAMAFALIVLSFLVTEQSALCRVVFGVFLPTIIHVLIFTGAFVALGALRGRSRFRCRIADGFGALRDEFLPLCSDGKFGFDAVARSLRSVRVPELDDNASL
jgi:hypothetical protein